ncbi:MAG: helix-turn-helix transcriptional regulator [Verrucomicrobiales bacterium]|nr:helix-turn-helix transcriptional regulator [Verrucomicrobiales bacterium]
MPQSLLPNYLRTYRKRVGFTQAEVAFLLGSETAGQVSRYEHFRRVPSLQTALAYEAIFRTPVRALLGGEYRKVESKLRRRAERLIARLTRGQADQSTLRKVSALRTITAAAPA